MRPPLPAQITDSRVVAICRGFATDALERTADALVEGGIVAVEVTLDSPGALRSIAVLRGRGDMVVGAGTVLDVDGAARAVDAGAAFLVAPNLDPAVAAWCGERVVPFLPGAFTPTEVVAAWNAGAAAVKLFPAEHLGPAYLRAVKAPLAHVTVVPTGGVDATSVSAWLTAGAAAVGAGGWLLGDGEPDGIRQRAARLTAAVTEHGAAR